MAPTFSTPISFCGGSNWFCCMQDPVNGIKETNMVMVWELLSIRSRLNERPFGNVAHPAIYKLQRCTSSAHTLYTLSSMAKVTFMEIKSKRISIIRWFYTYRLRGRKSLIVNNSAVSSQEMSDIGPHIHSALPHVLDSWSVGSVIAAIFKMHLLWMTSCPQPFINILSGLPYIPAHQELKRRSYYGSISWEF